MQRSTPKETACILMRTSGIDHKLAEVRWAGSFKCDDDPFFTQVFGPEETAERTSDRCNDIIHVPELSPPVSKRTRKGGKRVSRTDKIGNRSELESPFVGLCPDIFRALTKETFTVN